jgi:predicted transcriptional regulator
VSAVLDEPIRLVGAGQSIDDLAAILADTDTLMVARDGKPIGILTRRDLLVHRARS